MANFNEITEKIRLVAKGGIIFEVEPKVAFKSKLIMNAIEDLGNRDVELNNMEATVLRKILEYCEETKDEVYVPKGPNEDQRIQLTQKEIDFLDISDDFLMEVLKAANFLDVGDLVDIICQKIANMIEGKNIEEILEIYGLPDDRTEEEKEAIKSKYGWLDA